ncbi:MAG: tetratricopeptide repeat protein [Draconibacterium sp.]
MDAYKAIFENFILYFNEKVAVQDNAHNHLSRGIFYSLTGKYSMAIEDLDKAIQKDEKLAVSYFCRANSRYKMHEQMELVANGQENVSIALNKTGNKASDDDVSLDYRQILDDYEITLFLNPKFFFGYYNRAYIKLRLGEYKSAVEDLNQAIRLEPKFAEAYFNRGLTKIYLDDVEGGAIDLSRAGELGIEGAYNIIKRYCN